MIAYIKGEITEIEEHKIVIENSRIGYTIFVPGTTVDGVLHVGDEAKIYTYLHVKEDLMQLYGFLTKDELHIFQLLIGVNGIGPKGAIGLLSGITADELRFAVLSNDAAAISKAPGIGKKTAQKLILELKDKLKLEDTFKQHGGHGDRQDTDTSGISAGDGKKEAIQALVALGYSNTDAFRAVKQVGNAELMNVEEILKQALKKMG